MCTAAAVGRYYDVYGVSREIAYNNRRKCLWAHVLDGSYILLYVIPIPVTNNTLAWKKKIYNI